MTFQHRLTTGLVTLIPHITAALLALTFAWYVSQTPLATTGVQFVAPLLVIFLLHTIWLCFPGQFPIGIFNRIYLRTAKTAAGLFAAIFLIAIFAPQPAATEQIIPRELTQILVVIFCLLITFGIPIIVVYAFFGVLKLLEFLIIRLFSKDEKSNKNKLYDVSGLLLTGVIFFTASLEGVKGTYFFASKNESTASNYIAAYPAKVWQAMETATSPAFPLPGVLHIFPQPVAVLTDEGTHPYAKRVVKIKGREGEGLLTLQVIRRTETEVVFAALSDTSPIANWVQHKQITYRVVPEGIGTRLAVSLSYDRKLAPSWFFTPFTRGAAYLAMDVLARDVKERAES